MIFPTFCLGARDAVRQAAQGAPGACCGGAHRRGALEDAHRAGARGAAVGVVRARDVARLVRDERGHGRLHVWHGVVVRLTITQYYL